MGLLKQFTAPRLETDVIDTNKLKFVRTAGLDKPFQGIVLNSAGTAVNNANSGPGGVVAHRRWLYAGDGDSTVHVIDLEGRIGSETKRVISSGGTKRVDEMALTSDGNVLLAANNADDPAFATLFHANGDSAVSGVSVILRITVDPTILPVGFGLGIEQPAWDPTTERFYTSIPTIANNPPGCNYGQFSGSITCSGGLLVTDPATPAAVQGAYDPATNTGVIPLTGCGPNGATVGPHDNLLLGCTPGNLPGSTTTQVINAATHNYAQVAGITGSDEVWFNEGDGRYYTGSNNAIKPTGSPLNRGSVLGVIDATTVLIETIPPVVRLAFSGGRLEAQPDLRSGDVYVVAHCDSSWRPELHSRRRQPDGGSIDLWNYQRVYRRLHTSC